MIPTRSHIWLGLSIIYVHKFIPLSQNTVKLLTYVKLFILHLMNKSKLCLNPHAVQSKFHAIQNVFVWKMCLCDPNFTPFDFCSIYGLRTPSKEIAFTAQPKIQSQSQIFRYIQSIFCLPHRPKFSDFFDLCLWVSVVRGSIHHGLLQKTKKKTNWIPFWIEVLIISYSNANLVMSCTTFFWFKFRKGQRLHPQREINYWILMV